MNVGFISLGCSKNLIDTEVTIGHFKKHQYEIVNNPEKAEIIVINTCGFIENAKTEAINTISYLLTLSKIEVFYITNSKKKSTKKAEAEAAVQFGDIQKTPVREITLLRVYAGLSVTLRRQNLAVASVADTEKRYR